MHVLKINISLFISVLVCTLSYSQEYLEEGLFFASHEQSPENRTSLNITPEKPLYFEDGFSLEFKANFRDKDGYFGNIFKIIGENNLNIGLVANTNYTNISPEEANFWLVVNDSILMRFEWVDIPNGGLNKWLNFEIKFDPVHSLISMSVNGEQTVKKTKSISKLKRFDLAFGKIAHKKAFTNEVAPMSLKHIKLWDSSNILVRHWALSKHTNDKKVYDEISKEVAIVENPTWLIDEHVFWKKNKELSFSDLIGSAYDEINERVFFIDREAIYIYHLESRAVDTLVYNGTPFPCLENTFVYNPYYNELWSYSFDNETLNKFDFSSNHWILKDAECPEPAFWQHNKIISPIDSTLITFGGYGFFRYKSDIKNFNNKTSKWTNFDKRQSIEPRHRSSTGVLDENSFLVFGGLGSKSGRQVANVKHYYDLFSVNFNDFTVKKLWRKERLLATPTLPVQSMVFNSSRDAFYTMIFDNTNSKTNLKLARFGIDDFDMLVYNDSIPYTFHNNDSNVGFFLNGKKTTLYTLTAKGSEVSVRSLSYPPLLTSEVLQEVNKTSSAMRFQYLWVIIAIAIIIAAFLLIRFFFIKQKLKSKLVVPVSNQNGQKEQPSQIKHEKRVKSAIYVFGGFQVFDKKGNDITAQFTPTLRQLFMLILLYGLKNEKGISSNKLTELLWFDKTGSSARNNRNVNISKLRILLEKIGDVHLSNDNTYWSLKIGGEVFCDYIYISEILRKISDASDNEIYKFIKTVSTGEICPDIQTEWMDGFKVDIENQLIDGLEVIANTKEDSNLLIIVADTILKYAPLNEEAIFLKCRTLYSLGKKGVSKKAYDSFCEEYQSLLATKYELSFRSIVD